MLWDLLKIPIYEKWKAHWFDTHPHDLAEYSWNYLFTGGKEIRAHLFCELWHYLSPDSEIDAEFAFMIECIHVASLILDDTPWMDNADLRREKQTLHRVFSDKKALLFCHDVMSMVRQIWLSKRPKQIDSSAWIYLLRSKLLKLIVGQWLDLFQKGSLSELASFKTGVLFEFTSELVAVLNEFDPEFWREWGNRLGILFQWMDDWKDREEDQLQKNRNAFNESYVDTLHEYSVLWNQIQQGIGSDWFLLPFGKKMKTYFTKEMSLVPFDPSSVSLDQLLHSFQTPYVKPPSFSLLDPIKTSLSSSLLPEMENMWKIHKKEWMFDLVDQVLDLPVKETPYDAYFTIENQSLPQPVYEWMNERHRNNEDLVQLMKTLFFLIQNLEDIEPLAVNLWEIPESEWADHPEIQRRGMEWIQKEKDR